MRFRRSCCNHLTSLTSRWFTRFRASALSTSSRMGNGFPLGETLLTSIRVGRVAAIAASRRPRPLRGSSQLAAPSPAHRLHRRRGLGAEVISADRCGLIVSYPGGARSDHHGALPGSGHHPPPLFQPRSVLNTKVVKRRWLPDGADVTPERPTAATLRRRLDLRAPGIGGANWPQIRLRRRSLILKCIVQFVQRSHALVVGHGVGRG
jgi:hypothetical protein